METQTDHRVRESLAEYQAQRLERDPWVPVWEDVGYFVHRRSYNFVGGTQKGTAVIPYGGFTPHGAVYSSRATIALDKLSSALLGMLWKNGARTFQLRKPSYVKDTTENKAFYEKLNTTVIKAMEHPSARLTTTLNEDMREQVSFGVSGIGVFWDGDPSAPLRYKSYSVRNCTIIEDETGRIDGVFIEESLTRRQLIQRYGERGMPSNAQANYDPLLDTTKVDVVHEIKPNKYFVPGSLAANQLPYSSLHYEKGSGKILRDSGFEEMPIKFSRFEKNCDEAYARCPAINALPAIYEVNEAVRQLHIGVELDSKLPYGLLDDGTFGGGTIDRSPGGFTIIDVSGRIGGNPLIPLHQPVNRQPQMMLVESLNGEIDTAFFLDQVLDLNNQQRQTLGEANIRNEIRSEPLAAIMSRQLEEKHVPLIETTVNLLYSNGWLGVVKGSEKERMLLAAGIEPAYIPDEIAQVMADGKDYYDIQFVSPAARMMRAEELRGVTDSVRFAAELQPLDGGARLRRYDADKIGRLSDELHGVPESVLKSEEEYKAGEEAYAEQQNLMMQQMAVKSQAEIGKMNAAANQSNAQAQATLALGNGGTGMNGNLDGV